MFIRDTFGQNSFDEKIFKTISIKLLRESNLYSDKLNISSVLLRTNWETNEKSLDTISCFSNSEEKIIKNKSESELIDILQSKDYSIIEGQEHYYILDTINFFSDLHKTTIGNKSCEIIHEQRKENDYYTLYGFTFDKSCLIVAFYKKEKKKEVLLNFYFEADLSHKDVILLKLQSSNLSLLKAHFGYER